MKVRVIRTAMVGGGLSYDVYVPVPASRKWDASIWRSRKDGDFDYCDDFVAATQPESIKAMPKGLERWDAFKAHEECARRTMLDIAESVFPELAAYRARGENKIPVLWVNDLLPKGVKETSAEFTVEWNAAVAA